MARILNACPVTIELARLAAQVREHAPYAGPRPYTASLRDLGMACDLERIYGVSDRLWMAVCCAASYDSMRRNPATSVHDPIMQGLEREAIAHLMASPEWFAWIAERGPCADADLTPEARAENEWKRNMADASVRNVTRLT